MSIIWTFKCFCSKYIKWVLQGTMLMLLLLYTSEWFLALCLRLNLWSGRGKPTGICGFRILAVCVCKNMFVVLLLAQNVRLFNKAELHFLAPILLQWYVYFSWCNFMYLVLKKWSKYAGEGKGKCLFMSQESGSC